MYLVVRKFFSFLALLLIATCGQLPLPFQYLPGTGSNSLVDEIAAHGFWIKPLDGVSRPMSKLLAVAVVEGFQLRGLRATTDPNVNSRYQLKGKAAINKADFSQPFVVLITWSLLDYSGKLLGSEVMGVPGSLHDWHFGSPVVLAEIGKATPDIIMSIIDADKNFIKSNILVESPKNQSILVNQVTNAPGDGNNSLTLAIKEVIQREGIQIAKEPHLAKFILDGRVAVGLSMNSLQRVEIVWVVSTSDNKEVGQVTQKNTVKAGVLSDSWGEVARGVAGSALEGIKGIIQHAKTSPHNTGDPLRTLKMTPHGSEGLVLPQPRLDLEGFN